MTCNNARGVLDAYLDGELLVEDKLQAHEHFARCESCRRIAKAEAALHTLMAQAVTDEEVPAGLRERIWVRVEAAASRAGERPQRRRLRPGRLWLAASALVVAMLSWLLVGWIARDRTTLLTAELASKHVLYAEARGSIAGAPDVRPGPNPQLARAPPGIFGQTAVARPATREPRRRTNLLRSGHSRGLCPL